MQKRITAFLISVILILTCTGCSSENDAVDYSKIENGKRYLTFEQCRRIAIALDTSMDYLAGLTDEKNPYPRSASLENQG